MLRPPQPDSDLETLKEIDPNIKRSIDVIKIKVNHVETPDEVAARIAKVADAVRTRRIASPEPINLLKGMAAPCLALPVRYPAIPQIPLSMRGLSDVDTNRWPCIFL